MFRSPTGRRNQSGNLTPNRGRVAVRAPGLLFCLECATCCVQHPRCPHVRDLERACERRLFLGIQPAECFSSQLEAGGHLSALRPPWPTYGTHIDVYFSGMNTPGERTERGCSSKMKAPQWKRMAVFGQNAPPPGSFVPPRGLDLQNKFASQVICSGCVKDFI